MSKSTKRVYNLIISFDIKEDTVDSIIEYIDQDVKTFYYGELNIGEYFDAEGVRLVEDSYELGES